MSSSILSVHIFLNNFFSHCPNSIFKIPYCTLVSIGQNPHSSLLLSSIQFIPVVFHSCQSKSFGTVKKESHLYQPESLLFLETLFSPFHPVIPILPTCLFFRASSHPISLLWSYLSISNHINLFLFWNPTALRYTPLILACWIVPLYIICTYFT